jgi:hypothetical protein
LAAVDFVITTTNLDAKGSGRRGARILALVAPLEALGGSESANVVKRVIRVADAEEFFGVGSKLALGAKAAINSGARPIFEVAADDLAGSPFTETFGTGGAITTGTLTAANLPLTEITAASRDGSNILAGVKFTSKDPATVSPAPAAAEVFINPKTGAFKLGTATTGAGAGFVVTYKSHDWQAAFNVLALEDYEILAPAGFQFTAQNFGIYDKFLTEAEDRFKLVCGGLADGVAVTDVGDATANSIFDVADIGTKPRLNLLAAFYASGDDLTSAWAGDRVADVANGTSKMQPAPEGVTYDDSYLEDDFGAEESPAAGTWHAAGVNAVIKNEFGAFEVTNDRSRTPYTDFQKFWSTTRNIRAVNVRVEGDLINARRRSSVAIPFTQGGMEIIRGVIENSLSSLLGQGLIAPEPAPVVIVPNVEEVDATDRANRVVTGVEYTYRLPGQVHLVKIVANVSI